MIEVIDSISDPGSSGRANEDAFGAISSAAFVIDGATGLGDRQVMPGAPSDAAWLAGFAVEHFAMNLEHDEDVPAAVSSCIAQSAERFETANGDHPLERYAWPSASFVLLQPCATGPRLFGLGDCTIYSGVGEQVDVFSPLSRYAAHESDWASRHIGKAGGFGRASDLLANPETLKELRTARALQNTPQSGIWTLGLEPAAADNLATAEMRDAKSAHCLLCSDGFSALVDSYRAYTPATLLETALSDGLDGLLQELRHIEREVDPDGTRFPRFKRSDDATALLVKIGG